MFEIFQHEQMLWLLWSLPGLLLVFYYAATLRKKALDRFADHSLREGLIKSIDAPARRWKVVLVLIALLFVILATARPAWGEKKTQVERRGRDVVFILDVSRSMLAKDGSAQGPSRLKRSKIAIQDCVDRLEGDRVGLVIFAGSAVVKCPLTVDYGFFRMMLADVSHKSVGQGGTNLGDAIRKCVTDVFDDQKRDFRDIVLITDGEDHESFPLEAAAKAGEAGIRMIAIGIGDEKEGRRILLRDDNGRDVYLKDSSGKPVWSKLNATILRKMVDSTPGGRYLNVSTGTIDLGQVYLDLIASADKKELEKQDVVRLRERFQIFLIVAFALLLLEPIISERRRHA